MQRSGILAAITALAFGLFGTAALGVNIDLVTVGDPGNAADTRLPAPSYGAVGYTYSVGKYEVTAGQYADFLNKVAATDTYGLYNPNMGSSAAGCRIQRNGSPGAYTYSVASDYANRPVNYVSWGDAARFANWLDNGQPAGDQNLTTTEDGAYTLNGAMTDADLLAVNRKSNARWAIASENEWYKAAYYKGGSISNSYWTYPARTFTAPGRDLADASGNNANYSGTPLPIDSPYYTTLAGEFQNSTSPYGTFDQGGNVMEWTEGLGSYSSNTYRALRGGSFRSTSSQLANWDRTLFYPSFERDDVGLRVALVPEPATLALLAIAAMALTRRR